MRIRKRHLAAALARKGLRQWQLAARLGVSPPTLNSWVGGAPSAPSDLVERIEAALKLPRGTLATDA